MSAIYVPEELTPRGPADATPERRPGSLRRTTTIDMTWSDGLGTDLWLAGRGRDLLTPERGAPVVLHEERVDVDVSPGRKVLHFVVRDAPDAEPREIDELVGSGAMGGFRATVADQIPELQDPARPSSLLVDDTPGATLISGFAAAQWIPVERLLEISQAKGHTRPMVGICTGFMPGSSGLAPDGSSRWTHRTRAVRPLAEDPDPWAWHEVAEISEMSMRRMRRIDVWLEGELIRVDAMFQDSATTPDGGRVAVHEYGLTATAGLRTGELLEVIPEPRVLPYAECPLATRQVHRLVGVPLADLREVVLTSLAGTAGCTHLNDALRALGDVPAMARSLQT